MESRASASSAMYMRVASSAVFSIVALQPIQ
jgi:hypothetical protein